jgi:multiple sugar transport system permease protein
MSSPTPSNVKARVGHRHGAARLGRGAAWLLVGVGALLMLVPFYLMFVFATHPRAEILQLPPPLFFGDAFLANLEGLTRRIPFWSSLGWSVYVALISTALTLLFCSMGGYAFAMFEFAGKRVLFGLVIGVMLVPPFLGMISGFLVIDALGWIDEPRALYLPGAASAFGIFLMRQFIAASVPMQLIEAARLDGCSEWRIFGSVVLPMLGPALGTLGLVSFVASWNNFMGALVVIRSPDRYTLPLALRAIQSPVDTDWGVLMAGASVAVLPLLLLFAMFSRQLVAGLTAGAVRG